MARTEDIREKIRDLRERIPEAELVVERPPERDKLRLIVGALVFILIFSSIGGGITYLFYLKPKKEKLEITKKNKILEIKKEFSGIRSPKMNDLIERTMKARSIEEVNAIEVKSIATLERLRYEKLSEVEKIFTGPLAYNPEKARLRKKILTANSISELKDIDVRAVGTQEWRNYLIKKINESTNEKGKVVIYLPE
ncbi:MAG: hypothetical protein ACE5K4_02285 [Candidatus Hydrothermarchaeota archaeon]